MSALRARGARALPPAAALALIVAAAAVLAHAFLLWAPFVYDDLGFVLNDPRVTGPWPGLGAFFGRTFAGGEYEPLVALAHWALFRAFGASPWPYRLSSLLLHWANVALVWRLLRRWLADERLALAGAALFCVFPAHVEALALSTFKKHLGAAFFGLLLIDLQERAARSRPYARAALGALLLGLAALCKESGLVFLPLAAASALARRGARGLREDRVFLGALALSAAAYVGARAAFAPRVVRPLAGAGLVSSILTSAKILLWHLGQLAFPADLGIEHGLSPVRGLGVEGALAALGVLAWLAAGAALARRDKAAAFGWAWVTLALAPFLNLIPFLNFSLVANRYEYLASAGFLLLVGRLVAPLLRPAAPGGARRVLLAAAVPFALYAAESARFAALFDSPYELWSDAVRRAPDNPRARAALGILKASWHDDAGAEADLRRALALSPGEPEACLALSWLLVESGRPDEAVALARLRLGLRADATGWENLGAVLTRAGRFAEALPALERGAALAPGPDASLERAQCLLGLKRLDEAEAAARDALRDPALAAPARRALGDAAYARGRRAEAEEEWRRSLAVEPLQPETIDGLALALAKDGRRGEARALYDALIARLDERSAALETETPEQKTALRAYLEGLTARARERRARLGR